MFSEKKTHFKWGWKTRYFTGLLLHCIIWKYSASLLPKIIKVYSVEDRIVQNSLDHNLRLYIKLWVYLMYMFPPPACILCEVKAMSTLFTAVCLVQNRPSKKVLSWLKHSRTLHYSPLYTPNFGDYSENLKTGHCFLHLFHFSAFSPSLVHCTLVVRNIILLMFFSHCIITEYPPKRKWTSYLCALTLTWQYQVIFLLLFTF